MKPQTLQPLICTYKSGPGGAFWYTVPRNADDYAFAFSADIQAWLKDVTGKTVKLNKPKRLRSARTLNEALDIANGPNYGPEDYDVQCGKNLTTNLLFEAHDRGIVNKWSEDHLYYLLLLRPPNMTCFNGGGGQFGRMRWPGEPVWKEIPEVAGWVGQVDWKSWAACGVYPDELIRRGWPVEWSMVQGAWRHTLSGGGKHETVHCFGLGHTQDDPHTPGNEGYLSVMYYYQGVNLGLLPAEIEQVLATDGLS